VLKELLAKASELRASDLLLVAGAPPTVCRAGRWTPLDGRPLAAESVAAALQEQLSPTQRQRLENERDLDAAWTIAGRRYRVNVHYQRGSLGAAMRAIPTEVPAFETLGLPPRILTFADYPTGLVLVTGCTGQGKSTTLAAMIEHLNRRRPAHVITIEDPIEFEFQGKQCLIEQREIGDDSPSFASALRHVLRQRPDVIMVGEMRDLETIGTALTAAETGHLVLASLHTASATQTLSRIIDVFPPAQQAYVRAQLAASLRAIVCQRLLPEQGADGLVAATEILVATSGIRRALRDNETHLVPAMIETGRRSGMHTMEQCLSALVHDGRISPEDAFASATDAARLEKLIGPPPERLEGYEFQDHLLETATAPNEI